MNEKHSDIILLLLLKNIVNTRQVSVLNYQMLMKMVFL